MILIDKFRAFQQSLSIIDKNRTFTYEDLLNEIEFYTSILVQEDVKSGDIVCLIGDYSFEAISLFLALMLKNCIIVPIATKNESESIERISISKCDFIASVNEKISIKRCSDSSNSDKGNLVNELKSKGKAGLILFSSGSTGKPKAMLHDLDNLVSVYADRKPKNLRFIVFLLFDHIGGLNTMLNCLSMGATMIIPEKREPEHVAHLIEKYHVNVLPTSPTFLNLLLMSEAYKKFDLSSLLMITYGTEPMPESLLLRLREIFPKVNFLQTFGTSETGIAKTVSKSNNSTLLKFEDENQEFKVVDGELWIRSKTQILGYLNYGNESFTQDGWFKTGDIVVREGDFIRIIGRKKDVINVGGEKVFPQEVESVVLQLSFVTDVTAYSLPNSITGESVGIDVVLKPEVSDVAEAKRLIRNHCKKYLESYKVPTKINVLDAIKYSERFKKKR
ncbi:MAG: fatty acid--CoA ligase family protein [Cytophagales bacterium]|nr:fatty acid--CoA ligase family protein [Bernardetiaceae bacterium]MDW8210549.1 fatty acid--CoA ligase family protein [Cytophagales bacterium]